MDGAEYVLAADGKQGFTSLRTWAESGAAIFEIVNDLSNNLHRGGRPRHSEGESWPPKCVISMVCCVSKVGMAQASRNQAIIYTTSTNKPARTPLRKIYMLKYSSQHSIRRNPAYRYSTYPEGKVRVLTGTNKGKDITPGVPAAATHSPSTAIRYSLAIAHAQCLLSTCRLAPTSVSEVLIQWASAAESNRN